MVSHPRSIIDIGGMAGGKTLNLITRVKKLEWSDADGIPYVCFKPDQANRGEGSFIESRFGKEQGSSIRISAKIVPFDQPFRIIDELDQNPEGGLVEVVVINEMHMWNAPLLGATIDELHSRGKVVFGDVLKLDAGGFVFEIVNYLLSRDAEFNWLYGQCTHPSGCRQEGTHSQLYHVTKGNDNNRELRRELAPYSGSAIQAGDESGSVSVSPREGNTYLDVDYQPRCLRHFIIPPITDGFTGNLVRPIPRFSEVMRSRDLSTYNFGALVNELSRREY